MWDVATAIASGVPQFGARYYDPVTGRFLSADPSRFTDSRNLYALTGNNPNLHDPDGRLAAGAGKGAVMGDYAEYGSIAQAIGGFLGQVGVGFTPAGVAGDVRDFTAAANELNTKGLGWNTGLSIGLSTIAFVPGVGDAIKGVFKPLLRAAEDVPVNAVVNAVEEGVLSYKTKFGGVHQAPNILHNNAIEDTLQWAENQGATSLRKNRSQVDLLERQVSTRKPDASYVLENTRFNENFVSNWQLDKTKDLNRELEAFKAMMQADPKAATALRFKY